jgi:hypothetical protein
VSLSAHEIVATIDAQLDELVKLTERPPTDPVDLDLSKLRAHFELPSATPLTSQQVIDRAMCTLQAADVLNDATVRLVDGSARSDTEARSALKTFVDARLGLDALPDEAARQAARQQEGRL